MLSWLSSFPHSARFAAVSCRGGPGSASAVTAGQACSHGQALCVLLAVFHSPLPVLSIRSIRSAASAGELRQLSMGRGALAFTPENFGRWCCARSSPTTNDWACAWESCWRLPGDCFQMMCESPLIVPIPLHRSRHRQRGFNQAEQLAAGLVRALRRQRGYCCSAG